MPLECVAPQSEVIRVIVLEDSPCCEISLSTLRMAVVRQGFWQGTDREPECDQPKDLLVAHGGQHLGLGADLRAPRGSRHGGHTSDGLLVKRSRRRGAEQESLPFLGALLSLNTCSSSSRR